MIIKISISNWILPTGAICSTYDAVEVLIAVGMTGAVVFALTLFAMQTKIDFTVCGGDDLLSSDLNLTNAMTLI